MRTIIHIGQHKTGTTSIQHFLKDNRNELIESGLYIPDSLAGNESPSHYLLNLYSLAKDRSSPMKDKLLQSNENYNPLDIEKELKKDIKKHYKNAHKKKCKEIIWSNEGLYLLNSIKEYKKLSKLFELYSDEIVCICTFREKTAFLKSYTNHLLKQKIGLSNDENSYRFVEPTSWLINYARKKEILEQVFMDTVYIPYNQEDMVSTFMEYIGHNIDNPPTKRLNTSD